MKDISEKIGYEFIDSLPYFLGRDSNTLYAMPGDPHPNALGHKLLADAIFPAILND